ncbi:MAG: DUF3782 domain-containing protein [Pseudomonadota bacterium]
MTANTEQIKETIRRELPGLIQQDPALRAFVLDLTRMEYAPKSETESRFDRMLEELRRDREAQTRKWEEQARRWDEQKEEQNRKWEEQARRWDEQKEEQNRKWEEAGQRFDRIHEEIMEQARRHDRSIGALGARWGTQSEKAFRDALAGILEKSFGVSVLHVTEYDDAGEVFGRPDQVELDVIIRNGTLILCELKSSMDKPAMYAFERKARFYERRHQRQASRLIVVSPMIDARARKVGEKLGIEMYGDSIEVPA